MRSQLFKYFTLLFIAFIFVNWGSRGHSKISTESSLSYNNEMVPFLSWVSYLADHASDADYRKSDDPDEAVRHYIDIDFYPEFRANGRIAQAWDSIVTQHGIWIVTNTGILPWATISTYNSLKIAMMEQDWNQAMLLAADLGHYVADGFMPLHLTENYNGQMTGNSGIHSRFESTMINANINEIIYEGDSIEATSDVSGYIFNYIYANYPYMDSILAADNYAKTINSSTSSQEYRQALWMKSKNFTIKLFVNASHALAELIYSAWVEAGKPIMSIGIEPVSSKKLFTITTRPNPFTEKLEISYQINKPAQVSATLSDLSGRQVWKSGAMSMTGGDHQMTVSTEMIPTGIYIFRIESGEMSSVRKVLKVN
ncbi:MAG TPA: hypothetical protein DCR43_08970 [Bacteroidales bacterium]|nr:MAG: hypothetical protein A2X11_05095 [Bacteroidetes bacterium GWE2_42_24]OFY26605.1 MAG: hypothetical protein A2X09_03475 [Bacteroidetes bacterium GWF2_43_11]HAQ65964.1 hypothetical protein [Bacteroidales bacterium]HBZ67486.1 hypothetical protein [Bacteroidales bacterium]